MRFPDIDETLDRHAGPDGCGIDGTDGGPTNQVGSPVDFPQVFPHTDLERAPRPTPGENECLFHLVAVIADSLALPALDQISSCQARSRLSMVSTK